MYKLKHTLLLSIGHFISESRLYTFHFASSFPGRSYSSAFLSTSPLPHSWCSHCAQCLNLFDPFRLSLPYGRYLYLISIRGNGNFNFFCTSSELETKHHTLGFAELIARNEPTLESTLAALKTKFTVDDVETSFKLLNSRNVSGLRFFRWIRLNQGKISRSSEVCSFVVNNCGHLEDYESMASILKELSADNICLTKHAFFFLISCPRKDSLSLLTRRMIDILREAGGSCYSSGVSALVDAFSSNGLFPMAKYVIEHSNGKPSHIRTLIKEMCKRNQVNEAKCMLYELNKQEWTIPTLAFNYVISYQCKVDASEAWKSFEEMKEFYCKPDASTYEILITHLCRIGRLEDALKMVREMKVEPRLSTHILVIKEMFKAGKHEEAHKYVLCVDNKQANAVYSLLVKLHWEKGDIVKVKGIAFEMMGKGMVPQSKVFFKVVNGLRSSGNTHLASLLKAQFFTIVK